MDIITKRSKAQKSIMSIVNDVELSDDPSKDFEEVKNKMLEQDIFSDENVEFAKHYFTETMLNSTKQQHV